MSFRAKSITEVEKSSLKQWLNWRFLTDNFYKILFEMTYLYSITKDNYTSAIECLISEYENPFRINAA